jgi:hypothetical protein
LYNEYSNHHWLAYKGNTHRKNLTQEAVAFKAEIDRTFMNHVENGKQQIVVFIVSYEYFIYAIKEIKLLNLLLIEYENLRGGHGLRIINA